MKRLLLLLFGLLLSFSLAAQQMKVSGTVKDSKGEPLIGVSVAGQGYKSATSTDAEGNFTIAAKVGDKLTFGYLGYARKEIAVENDKHLEVVLLPDNSTQMTEITVVGYSKQERRDITGSVSSVKLPETKSVLSVDQMMLGQATGVYVSNSSGALGGANVLTIRGISSIMGDNEPLYVVDGVPVYSTGRSSNLMSTAGGSIAAVSMSGMQTGGGSLNNNMEAKYTFEQNPLLSINPDDIASIEILKDAFSTAIYGSRGAAGVILITTKSGQRDRQITTVQYTMSIDRPMGKIDLLNGDQYNMIYSAYYPKSNFTSPYNTDWQDAVMRTAYSHQVSASVSGGTQSTNYFISLSGSNNQSYIINNDLQRYSARANLDTKLGKKWTVGTSTTLSSVDNNCINAPIIYAQAIRKAPNLPVYDTDGKYYYGYAPNSLGLNEAYNPVALAYNEKQQSKNMNLIGNVFAEYSPVDWITWRTQVGTNVMTSRSYTKKPELPDNVQGVPDNQASETVSMNQRLVIDNTLNINKTFGQSHFLQGVVGTSYENTLSYANSIAGSNFFSTDMEGVGASQNRRVNSSGEAHSALFSLFSRLNYQFRQRYMAGVSYRYDGSSRFNRNHRFVHIPSLSLGWRFSEESFVRDNASWIDEGKLRGSVGWSSKDGNSNYYGAQAVYTLAPLMYGGNNYLSMTQPGNVNLRWEKTLTYDFGLDLSMFDNRLKLTLDYYYKLSSDMLFSSDLPAYTGYSKESQNIADMQNTGIEVQLISNNIRNRNFTWQTIFNFSRNTNKILKLNFEGNQLDQANSTYKYYAEGHAIAQWYLHDWAGVDPATGDPLWRLADGTVTTVPPASNYETSTANKIICGTAQPKFYGSMTNILTYKGIEMSFMFSYSVGGRMVNSTLANLLTYSTSDASNLSTRILNFWQLNGQKTDIPKLSNSSILNNYDYTTAITTTRFIENSSFLRLKTLDLSYSLPQKVLKKIGFLQQLKIYTTLTNLFTLTNYSGIDPEVSAFGSSALSSGYDNMTMPQSRSVQFGVRIGF